MNLTDILNTVVALDPESRTRWLIDLGWAMTVSARAGYPAAQQGVDPIPDLMAFNEIAAPAICAIRGLTASGTLRISFRTVAESEGLGN